MRTQYGRDKFPPWKEHPWKPTYQVCRKLPDGSRQAIANYFTSERAEAIAKTLNEQRAGQYAVFDSLTQKFTVFESEAKSKAALPSARIQSPKQQPSS